jgi:hypothetical protein
VVRYFHDCKECVFLGCYEEYDLNLSLVLSVHCCVKDNSTKMLDIEGRI